MTATENKKRLLEALRENHIALAACRKVGIGKSTYYRLRKSDPRFAKKADEAVKEGVELVNDAAEGVIIGAIKLRDVDASKFWLKHRHPEFKNQLLEAGIALAKDDDGDAIFKIFAELKPQTRGMLAPYLKKPSKTKHYGKA